MVEYYIYTRPNNYFGHNKCKYIIKSVRDNNKFKYYWCQLLQKKIIQVNRLRQKYQQWKNRSQRLTDKEYIKKIDEEDKIKIYETDNKKDLLNAIFTLYMRHDDIYNYHYVRRLLPTYLIVGDKHDKFVSIYDTIKYYLSVEMFDYNFVLDTDESIFCNSNEVLKNSRYSSIFYLSERRKTIYQLWHMSLCGKLKERNDGSLTKAAIKK